MKYNTGKIEIGRFRVNGDVCLPRLGIDPEIPPAEIGRPAGRRLRLSQVRTDSDVFFVT